ncbi:MAG TPA: DUF5686 family protein [Bacteroidales bacterium]|nr:DUF5686 family protein [Bacteroidales bacterium]
MIRSFLIILICFVITPLSLSQSIQGEILDANRNPVSYATVYVSELKHGTSANVKGEYLINLTPGTYTVVYQSLGYSPEIRTVSIGETDVTINITLQIQYYVIPEVRVTSTGEDPAYAIMRKTIGMAPYHLNQVKHYSADIYIKGSVVVRNIPTLIKKRLVVNEEQIKEGDVYLIESINKIEFNAPDKYDQTVISQQSTFPEADQADISPMDVVKASFYQPVLADIAISPLSSNAMSHYKFRYEGSTPQGNYIINKISVIPKRKSQQVFEGTIYIVEDIWCLHSVDLINENLAGSIAIKQIYTPVYDDIWMPVNHNFEIFLSVVGVKADGEYGSAVTYNQVEPNLELEKPKNINYKPVKEIIVEPEIKELSKDQAKIEQILQKEELGNRDMVRLSRLMGKEAEKSDTTSKELEIKRTTTVTIEENADLRDSSYWNSIRPIPLSDEELRSIRISDSIKYRKLQATSVTPFDSTAKYDQGKGDVKKFFSRLAFGKTFSNEDSNLSFRYEGVLNIDKLTFNSVDGFRYGTDFNISKSWESGNRLSIAPEFNWAFSRERFLWRINSTLTYNRMKQARLFIWAGRRSQDYNNSGGINPTLNMFTSLLFKDNHLKLYETNFITAGHRHELFNGFYLELRYYYESRKVLTNNTEFSLFRGDEDYKPNIPVNDHLPDPAISDQKYGLADHDHHAGRIIFTYTPRQKYRINNGAKSPAGSDYPTFQLTYDHGLNIRSASDNSSYDLLRFEVSKSKEIGAFSEYSWKVRTGGFISNGGIEFQDFIHFNSQPLPVLFNNYQDAFMLPAYYSLATPDYFVEIHARITTPYLLIKLLPVLSNTLMRENFSLSYLFTPATGHYYEIGYALSEILLLGKIGVYTGFEGLSYKATCVRFTFMFN